MKGEMGLRLNVSNSLQQLVDELTLKLSTPLPSIFHPHYIVTQTDGMNNWLKIEIADRLGVAANLHFLKPNDLITQIYYLLDGPYDQVLDTHNLQWVLYDVLGDTHFKAKYRHVAQYYVDSDIKRVAMAEKMADLFDQYQVYRPEMIEDWNETIDINSNESNWQKYLWQLCLNKVGSKMPDKTRIGKYILDSLKDRKTQETLKNRMPLVNFFGISIITSYHLQIFQALAKYIDVSFNLLNPAPNIYWFEDKSEKYIAKWKSRDREKPQSYEAPIKGNPLLTNWGKVIQDTFSLFFEDDLFFNHYIDKGIEPQPKHLLGKVQNDIYHNTTQQNRNVLLFSDIIDGSISINACFTPVREVEALHNYLVNLVDTTPNHYSPRDIVVMVPDIDLYAPYIKAIFNSAPYKFPYTIADERLDQENSLFGAIKAFLDLNTDSLKAEDVLQLLDFDYIKKRFQLSNISLLRKAVDLANIRFGIHGERVNDTIHVSWLNGLNRIMYGICLYSEDEYCLNNDCFFPVDLGEGETAEELIRFTHFVSVLIDSLTQQHKHRTLAEWGDYIIAVVDNLIYFTEEVEDQDYQVLLTYVEKLNVLVSNVDEKVGYAAFKYSFLNVITRESRSGNFASGGITFCSLIPMRSIPFKVVALLGMNATQFPRNDVLSGFNLIHQKPKKGDRNIKDNDKHLFLETVLSAQDHLFISYIGKNVKDNSVIPPSILVDELIDYIVSGVSDKSEETVIKELVISHPLHNFSTQPKRVFNYIGPQNKSPGEKVRHTKFFNNDKSNYSQIGEVSEVTSRELVDFFSDPFEFYYNQILNINYKESDILLRETEWFELDSLHQWIVKNDLLLLDEEYLSDYINVGVKKGLLPLKNSAIQTLNKLLDDLQPTKEKVRFYVDGFEEEQIQVHLNIDNIGVTGTIDQVYNDRLIRVLLSKSKNKHLLELYIQYLLAKASDRSLNALLIDNNSTNVYQFSQNAIGREMAIKKLGQLLQIYQEAHKRLFVFHPNFENEPTKVAKLDHKKFIKNALNLTQFNPYIQREYIAGLFEHEHVYSQYVENSTYVFTDIYSILQQ